MDCPICSWSSNDQKYLYLHETKLWRVVLAPNQSLIGRSVIHLKRHAGDLVNLTRDELLEWLEIVTILERALHIAFDTTMFNWSCYMNHSYQQQPANPHIHWWAVPRYDHPVTLNGLIFEDPQFGYPYDHGRWLEVSYDIHKKIAEQIRMSIKPSDKAYNL